MLSIARRLVPFTSAVSRNSKFDSLNYVFIRNRGYSSVQKPLKKQEKPRKKQEKPRGKQEKPKNKKKEEKKHNLLSYPVLPLKDTIKKFLTTVQPLVKKSEYTETKKVAKEFLKNDGPKLQALLEQAAEKEKNWLSKRWQRAAYLQNRKPVTVFSSPGMTLPMTELHCLDDILDFTSKAIFSMLKYKEMIDKGSLPIKTMGHLELELDNSQMKKVFGTCRIPKPKEDKLKYHPNSKHVLIMYKNHIYKLPVYNQAGKILSQKTIARGLMKIILKHTRKGTPFGLLTHDSRDTWAKSYDELGRSFENEAALRDIESSLFVVCLDEEVEADKGKKYSVQAKQLMHGGGSKQNAGNRWMDKTIQLCINPSGATGFTYEKSPADTQPIVQIMDYVRGRMDCVKFFKEGATSDFKPPKLLKLKTNPCLDKFIASAKLNVDKLSGDLHTNVLIYDKFGTELIKRFELSPDSFVQMAIQFAFYTMHGVPAATYESAHLRVFTAGRTEAIRSCSKQTVAFLKAVSGGDNAKERLRKAAKYHNKYAKEALMGRGVDRHLFGLKQMAKENNLPMPKFFESPGFVKSSNFRLSTSQVTSKYKGFLTHSPMTKDGYGVSYNPRDKSVILAISSWRSNKETCSDRFAKSLKKSFDKLKRTLGC